MINDTEAPTYALAGRPNPDLALAKALRFSYASDAVCRQLLPGALYLLARSEGGANSHQPKQWAAYNGTLFTPRSRPKFLAETRTTSSGS